nr:putative inactive leucine-rich repeat receptor-like protein kinase [Quercus suber]
MSLKGQFPQGIENCKSLQGLDLPFNKLSSAIPSNISTRLPYVTLLDLSRNNFSGEIPTDIANCVCLNFLKLDHDRLTGLVPNFTVPNVMKESYANNSGLCGGPLEPCKELGRKSDESHETFKSGFIVGYAGDQIASFKAPMEKLQTDLYFEEVGY